jgi:hypothetical protein
VVDWIFSEQFKAGYTGLAANVPCLYGAKSQSKSMNPEFSPQLLPDPAELDPYWLAEAVFIARLDALQEMGELRRASQITDEDELDDHWNDLTRLYRHVCWELGLAWPPRRLKNESDVDLEANPDG